MAASGGVMRKVMRGAAVLALAGCAAVVGACRTNPTTGRSQFQALSRDQEIALGVQASPQMTSEFGGKVSDAQLQAYVEGIGRALAARTEADNPKLPWEFTLLDSDVINAFALPGGKVFITRGLAERLTNEAQMAGVLGHEVGHVTARHINDRMAGQMGVGVLAVIAGAAANSEAVSDAAAQLGNIALLSYSRDEEHESDLLGMRYMSRLNYDPRGQMEVMQILAAASKGPRPPEFLSTHPYPEDRVKRIGSLLAGEFKATQNNPQYGLYPERYQPILARLKALPPARHRAMNGGPEGVALGAPGSWCLHCAAAESARSGER